jgi:hypothetical protein
MGRSSLAGSWISAGDAGERIRCRQRQSSSAPAPQSQCHHTPRLRPIHSLIHKGCLTDESNHQDLNGL